LPCPLVKIKNCVKILETGIVERKSKIGQITKEEGKMKKAGLLLLVLAVGLSMLGCQNAKTKAIEGAVIGGVIGAAAGGIIGHQSHSGAEGAVIGGAIGAATGALIGSQIEKPAGTEPDAILTQEGAVP
jgi:uncharacterized membrane protein YeaQ/YmgE (transglycosylase-associated protein family)